MLSKLPRSLRRYWTLRSLKNFWKYNASKEFSLDSLIPIFTKEGRGSDLKHCYGLRISRKYGPDDLKQFYCDARHLVLLNAGPANGNKTAIACIAFDFDASDSRIDIVQIQGASYPDRVGLTKEDIASMLAPFKWERLLLAFLCSIAKMTKIKSVRLQPGRKNHWYRGEKKQQFFMRYDVTARRSGFKFDQSIDAYVLDSTDANWPTVESEVLKQI